MRVLLDIDGVIADFCLSFTDEAQRQGLVAANWTTALQQNWDFDFQVSPVWTAVKNTPNWWMTLDPLVSRTEVLALNEVLRSHEVYFVTTRVRTLGYPAQEQSRLWLDSMGIHVADSQGIIATKHGTKGAIAEALNLDVALDDNLDNLRDLADHGIRAVARRWRYNEEWEPHVNDVRQFLEGYLGWKPTNSFSLQGQQSA